VDLKQVGRCKRRWKRQGRLPRKSSDLQYGNCLRMASDWPSISILKPQIKIIFEVLIPFSLALAYEYLTNLSRYLSKELYCSICASLQFNNAFECTRVSFYIFKTLFKSTE